MKQCRNCGTQLEETLFFCPNCGCGEFTEPHNMNNQYNGQYGEPDFGNGAGGGYGQYTHPMANITEVEFVNRYAPDLKKAVRNVALIGYICGGITALLALFINPLGLVDGLLMIGLSIAFQRTMKMGVAIGLCTLGAYELIAGLFVGSVPILWPIVGIYAVITANNIKKAYQQFKNQNGMF